MRMWMVNPSQMCTKHLLGEHYECHMISSSIRDKKSLTGFINNGLIDPRLLKHRHDDLMLEMTVRGFNHTSPIIIYDYGYLKLPEKIIDVEVSKEELNHRCKYCEVK